MPTPNLLLAYSMWEVSALCLIYGAISRGSVGLTLLYGLYFIIDGIGLYIIIIFLILLINKGINKAITYSVLGNLDRIFGFFFGFIRAYIIVVCIYTTINIVYNHNKWPINLNDAFTYAWVEKGSNYLIKEFPDKKEYEETKEKVQDI